MPQRDEPTGRRAAPLLCPSARGRPGQSVLIGVLSGTPEAPRIMPTATAVEVTAELLEMASPATPCEVFRFAAHCQSCACPHFSNAACQLAVRSVATLSEVTEKLPHCSIRLQCRWFRQEGPAMCRRCPQIVTDQYRPSAEMLRVVYGEDPPPIDPASPRS